MTHRRRLPRCHPLPALPTHVHALQLLKKFGEDARVDIVVSWPGGSEPASWK